MFLLALFSLVVAIIFFYNKNEKLQVNIFFNDVQRRFFDKAFLIVVGLTVIGCAVLWFVLGRNSYGIIEAGYFIPHIYDLSFGKTVYRDFEFLYGPLLLYMPYLIYKLFSFLYISISDGYIIALTINQVIGLCFLSYVLAFFNFNNKERNIIFILIAILSFPASIGLNYTLFRFTSPFFCFVFLWQIEKNAKINPFIYICLSDILSLMVLLVSPELGTAFYFTFLVYIFITALITKLKIYFLQMGVLFFSFVLSVYLWPDMFKGVTGFFSGGLNWPFVPCLTLIFFFIAVFVVSAGAGIQLKNIKTNLFYLSFMLLAFALIPGALGRCDPGHIFFNGLFLFILAYSFLRTYLRQQFYKVIGVIFIISLFSIYPYMAKYYIPAYMSSMGSHLEKLDAVPPWIISAGNYLDIDVNEKLRQRRARSFNSLEKNFENIDNITMPFVYGGEYYVPLNLLGKYTSLYYLNPGFVGSKYAVDKQLSDIKEKKPQYLLLPDTWENITSPADYGVINVLFFSYYPAVQKRNGNILYDPFIDYISSEYSYVRSIENYMLYKKNL
jgi:hypothetical protein